MRPHLASLVEEWRRHPKDMAVVAHRGNRALPTSYAAMAVLAGRFAAELERLGVGSGERVVVWGENSAEWIAAFFGCVLRGVIAVPLDPTGSAEFANRVVAEVTPRLIVGDAKLIAAVGAGASQRSTVESAGAVASPEPPSGLLRSIVLADLAEVLPREPRFEVAAAVTLDSPLQIVFTSGTTSEPKGVVHTHRNVLASVGPIEAEIAKYIRYERPFHPLRFLHTLPLSHVFGQFMGMWLPPLLGAEVHFIDGLEPARLVATIRRERISVLVAVPRILELLRGYLLQRFPGLGERLDASGGIPAWKRWWRFRAVHRALGWKFWALICGGATLPAELEGFWNGVGLALVQGYGMTETAALVTLNHPFHTGRGTLGKALPGREVRLTAEGEIEVRGDMLAAGTWRQGRFAPREGEWLATGDLGTRESTGELRFAGRKGDVIVTAAGLNIHPQDLEAAMLAEPGVRGCAVVGCETAVGSESVAVVLFEGVEGELRAVTESANGRLAAFQQMRYVLRWPEASFPYTATGKLLRRRIAAWACAQITPGAAAGAGPNQDALLRWIEEITRQPLTDGSDEQRLTEDLHLDSLGRVQLQSEIGSRLGVEIGDAEMAGLRTLGELRALLRGGVVGAGVPESGLLGGSEQRVSFGKDNRKGKGGTQIPFGKDNRKGRDGTRGPFGKDKGRDAFEGRGAVDGERISYPRWPWSGPMQWIRAAFLEVVAMPLVRLLAKPRVRWEGADDVQGPLLLIANHVNTYDLPLVLYALPGRLRRHVAPAMSAEVLGDLRHGRKQGNAVLNLLARPAAWLIVGLLNVFPLPRLSGFRRSFAHAGEAMDRGYSVLVFPEGRRSETGELAGFRPGIGLLVKESRVPVLAIAILGTGTAERGDGRWFRSGRIEVRVGQAVRFAEGDSAEEITRVLEGNMRALMR